MTKGRSRGIYIHSPSSPDKHSYRTYATLTLRGVAFAMRLALHLGSPLGTTKIAPKPPSIKDVMSRYPMALRVTAGHAHGSLQDGTTGPSTAWMKAGVEKGEASEVG